VFQDTLAWLVDSGHSSIDGQPIRVDRSSRLTHVSALDYMSDKDKQKLMEQTIFLRRLVRIKIEDDNDLDLVKTALTEAQSVLVDLRKVCVLQKQKQEKLLLGEESESESEEEGKGKGEGKGGESSGSTKEKHVDGSVGTDTGNDSNTTSTITTTTNNNKNNNSSDKVDDEEDKDKNKDHEYEYDLQEMLNMEFGLFVRLKSF
jgi:hypothetical protein